MSWRRRRGERHWQVLLALALSCLGEERLQLARPRLWVGERAGAGVASCVSARREPDETHVLSYMRVETCVLCPVGRGPRGGRPGASATRGHGRWSMVLA